MERGSLDTSPRAVDVVDVDRPNRQARHRVAKSDPTDALAAARVAVSGVARAKTGDGPVEAMGVTLVAKRSARGHRIDVVNQIRYLVVCGPEPLRERLRGCSTIMLINTPAAMRPRPTGDVAADTTTRIVVELARRARQLTAEAKALDQHLQGLVDEVAPELVARPGIGADTAAILLTAAGDNPNRLRSQDAWCTCAAQHRSQHHQARPSGID